MALSIAAITSGQAARWRNASIAARSVEFDEILPLALVSRARQRLLRDGRLRIMQARFGGGFDGAAGRLVDQRAQRIGVARANSVQRRIGVGAGGVRRGGDGAQALFGGGDGPRAMRVRAQRLDPGRIALPDQRLEVVVLALAESGLARGARFEVGETSARRGLDRIAGTHSQ